MSWMMSLLWAVFALAMARRPQQRARAGRTAFMFGMLALFAAILWNGGTGVWPMAAAWAVLTFAWGIARHVLVPLGAWRSAWLIGSFEVCRFGEGGTGLVAGAWACLRRGQPPARALAWLERRRDRMHPLGAPALFAGALISAARGDDDGARELCESLDLISPERCPYTVALAREWRAADAAERGAWWKVVEIAALPGPHTAAGAFLGAVGRRLSGRGAPVGDAELVWRWLWAGSHRNTRPLLQRARATATPAEPTTAAAPVAAEVVERDAIAAALAMHARLMIRPSHRVQMQDVEALGSAWDHVFASTELRDMLQARAAALDVLADPERVTRALATEVRRELAALARAAGHRIDLLARGSDLVDGAARLVHDQLLGELELGLAALATRRQAARALPPFAEWREFLALRALHDRAVALGGATVRHLAFPETHQQICNLAVWLWNERGERTIANAMFRWLLEQALAVGDQEAIDLQTRNSEE